MARRKKKKYIFIKVVFVLVLILIVGYFGYNEYKNIEVVKEEYKNVLNLINEKIPNSTLSDVDLNITSKVFDITVTSQNEKYLTNSGKVNRPLYSEKDKNVMITINVSLKNSNIIRNYLHEILNVYEKTITKNIKVIRLEMTDLDKVNEVLDNMFIPSVTLSNIYLPNEYGFYEGLSIDYSSSNQDILDNDGIVKGVGDVTLTAKVKLNDVTKTKSFQVSTKDNYEITHLNINFDDYVDKTYDETEYNNITLYNSLEKDGKARFKVEEVNSYILTKEITDISTISFEIQITDDVSFTKDTFVQLDLIDGSNVIPIHTEVIKDGNIHQIKYSSTGSSGKIRIQFTSEYKEIYILFDNLIVTRKINKQDIIDSINISDKISGNVYLPFTTIYGGKITYITDNNVLNSYGKLLSKEYENTTVKVKVTGFDFDIEFEKEIKIANKEYSDVIIKFIDLGKYGMEDCGEAILIKYEDTEVLIDGGDVYSASYKAIKEVLDECVTDKVLEYVIATHPHTDHIGSLDDVLKYMKTENIIMFEKDAETKVYENFKNATIESEAFVCTVNDSLVNNGGCNKVITLADDVYIEFIDTKHYNDVDINSRSIVCVLNAYGVRTLLTGDADNKEYDIESAYMNEVGNIDILKMVHHGTLNGTSKTFLEAVDPEVIIICNGNYLGNKHGHPRYESIQRAYEYDENMLIYAVTGGDSENCTLTESKSYKCEVSDMLKDRNGTITITIDENGYTIDSFYNGSNLIEIKDTKYYIERSKLND